MTVYKGVNFNKKLTKRTARWVIFILPILVMSSLVHEFIYRDLSDDEEEGRVWCVLEYSKKIISYSSFILSFHTVAPFFANLFSAIFIIVQRTRLKSQCRNEQNDTKRLRAELKEHRHLIVSPLVLAILSLPRVIISLIPSCVKANRNPWLYLSGYFISFIPSVVVFVVFVVPSPLYRQEFVKSGRLIRQRISKNEHFHLTPMKKISSIVFNPLNHQFFLSFQSNFCSIISY